MRLLVIGSGGREHALVWKLSQSPDVSKVYCAPGNGGISQSAELVDIEASDIASLVDFAEHKQIDLTIVGPEAPLVAGIVDIFQKRGLRVFGPTKKAAQLEGSKVFSKQLMHKYRIPTATFAAFDDPAAARDYVKQVGAPIVVKADGLCAGKGTIMAQTIREAMGAVDLLMVDRIFGAAGDKILIEERLEGPEISIIVMSDGSSVVPLLASQDHKRLQDGDKGPNTGGMGAYAPAPIADEAFVSQVMDTIVQPTIRALASEGIDFKGVLYTGLLLTAEGPKVLEYNVRFGDPEIQAILPLLQTDLLGLLDDTVESRLGTSQVKWKPGSCAAVVLASQGYPGEFRTDLELRGLDRVEAHKDVWVFHAGTKRKNHLFVSTAGRVVNVVGMGADLDSALKRVYLAIQEMDTHGLAYRKDIGFRALERQATA